MGLLNLIKQKLGYTAPQQNVFTSRVNPELQRRAYAQQEDPRQAFRAELNPKKVAERALVKARRSVDPEKRAKLVDIARRARDSYNSSPVGKFFTPEQGKIDQLRDLGISDRGAGILRAFAEGYGGSAGTVKNTAKKAVSSVVANIKEPTTLDRVRRVLTSGEAELSRQGPAGRELKDVLLSQRKLADQKKGGLEVKLKESLTGLRGKEREAVSEVLEGVRPAATPRIADAARNVRALLDEVGTQAQKVGAEIRLPSGKSVPFRKRSDYFPRVYDFDSLQKGARREAALKHLVESGQAQNIADADRILEQFIQNNVSRKAGNLEYARTVDLPGYEKDPLKAVGRYIESSSQRLAELETFGKDDAVAKSLIERVRSEGGDSRYAQEVFDLMTGQKKYKNTGVDLATKFNYITKLDLGFITNATQPVNVATKYGVLPTLKGIIEAYGSPRVAGNFARKAGSIEDPITKGRAEGLSMGRIMETVLSPFSFIEKKNRVIASVAGREAARSNAVKLLRDPKNKAAMRRLRELGIEPEKILSQGGLRIDDILGASYEAARTTQFKVDAIDIPPGWKTNIGRLLTQFKSFSFQQSRFIRDAVLVEAFKHGNFVPLMRLTALAVPASFVAQSVRNKLTGRSEEDSSGLDIRKWDKYLKAFGTIPTDLTSQAKFLFDTYNSPTATALKKAGRTASTFLGPTIGEATNLVDAGEQAGQNWREDPTVALKRAATGYLPFVGEYAKNKLFPYEKKEDPKTAFGQPQYKESDDAPSNALETAVLYGRGIFTDPRNTLQAAFTKERLRKITGNAAIFERDQMLGERDPDKETIVDHIIPLALGGSNSENNLRVITKEENQAKTREENRLLKQLSSGEKSKKQVQSELDKWVKTNQPTITRPAAAIPEKVKEETAAKKSGKGAERSVDRATFNLKKAQFKRKEDLKGAIKLYGDRIDFLAEQVRTGELSEAQKISTMAEIERLTSEIQKYDKQGGFTKAKKAKKGGKGKRKGIVIRGKGATTASQLIKFARPSAPKPKKIALNSPRVKLASLKAPKPQSSKITPVSGRRIKIKK